MREAPVKYVLIESRSTVESPDVEAFLELAAQLGDAGHEVSLFLVQNAVLMAAGTVPETLARLRGRERVTIWADDLSLAARALDGEGLAEGVRLGDMSRLVSLVMRPGSRPVWH